MSIDMSQFYQTFFEESFEGLDAMESGLLGLDVGAADEEIVNTIFRAAHSIKGGSATFGFTVVSDFTHVMETLLDEMRSGSREVTREAVDLLLVSVDCLREMLTAVQAQEDVNTENVSVIQKNLECLLHGEEITPGVEADTSVEADNSQSESTNSDEVEGWNISFTPHDYLLKTGNDPVRILKELSQLGQMSVIVCLDKLPPFLEMIPEDCYLYWKIELLGDVAKESVVEVFEWVDEDCDLKIDQIGNESENTKDDNVANEAEELTESPSVIEDPIEIKSEVKSEKVEEPATSAIEKKEEPSTQTSTEKEESKPKIASVPKSNLVDVDASKNKKAPAAEQGSIRVSIDKVDELINMVGELVITQSMLGQLGENITTENVEKLQDGLAQLERNTRELQESVMRIRMLPISFAFQRFPRMVRDLSQKLEKEIDLQLLGEQTELDKTVMEKIGDPLVHLVRNSIDHGIESPDVREEQGKPRQGTVQLNAFHQGGNIVIEIADDGKGIDKDAVLGKAIEKGLVSENENLTDEQIYDLIFAPGFSTAAEVSDLSGRGVGMDVVKRNIRELGGLIEIKSQPGQGSTFTIRLPLTLAILDGQLIRVGEETYIVPLISIIESLQVKSDQVNAIAGQAEVYKLRDEYIPIVRLYDIFGLLPDSENLKDGLIVIVEGDGNKAGLYVDDLLGQQQVVIKSLDTNFRPVDGVSGATILGDGTVALILDVTGLIKLSQHSRKGLAA